MIDVPPCQVPQHIFCSLEKRARPPLFLLLGTPYLHAHSAPAPAFPLKARVFFFPSVNRTQSPKLHLSTLFSLPICNWHSCPPCPPPWLWHIYLPNPLLWEGLRSFRGTNHSSCGSPIQHCRHRVRYLFTSEF